MKKQFFFILAVIIMIAFNSCDHSDPEMLKNYNVYNRSISPGKDAGGVHLNDGPGGGVAWIKDKKFRYGTIEFDAKGNDEFQASFVGIAFHGVNDTAYEVVYFRPFNFRSPSPDRKAHAVQYIAMPNFDWDKLREEHPGEYEQPVSQAPDPNFWFHVRITVESKTISVYVNGGSSPALIVTPLVNTGGDWIGYWVGSTSAGDWRNFKIVSAKNKI
jgi:hypothetical protein